VQKCGPTTSISAHHRSTGIRQRSLDAFVTVYSENARSFEWRKAEARRHSGVRSLSTLPALIMCQNVTSCPA